MQGDERGLPDDVALLLAPQLRRALDHPTRRRILRALNRAGDAQTISDLAEAIPGAWVSTIGYHTLVLEECGCVSVAVGLSVSGTPGRTYASNIADNREVIGALQVTRHLDEVGY